MKAAAAIRLFAAAALAALATMAHAVGEPRAIDPAAFGPGGVYTRVPAIDDRGRDQLSMFRFWNPDPVGNHERNLASVRPELAAVIRQAIAGHPELRFVVGSGLRTDAEQAQAERWGWSPPRGRGALSPALRKHIDGEAVDLWPLDEGGQVIFEPRAQARVAAVVLATARQLGVRLSWGGNWRGRKDPTHFELVR